VKVFQFGVETRIGFCLLVFEVALRDAEQG